MFDYQRGLAAQREPMTQALHRVLDSGQLILGPETQAFEDEFAQWTDAGHCVAVHSGTQALYLALRALEIGDGDEVITVANTCAPTISAIRQAGATPVFVDIEADTLMMDVSQVERAISSRTRALLPVHLWGNAVDIESLQALAKAHGLPIVEDCAQACGTEVRGQKTGTFGTLGCYSFYPSKNLGAYGDGGAIVTDDKDLAQRLKLLRMYGYDGAPVSQIEGVNARINELQCAFLRLKLPVLDAANDRRRQIAARYDAALQSVGVLPVRSDVLHSYHQYVVRCKDRDAVTAKLDAASIQWGIHYATPVHLMPAYAHYRVALPVTEAAASEILSVPVHDHLSDEETAKVIATIS